MKKLFTLTAALAFLLFSFALNAQRNCGTMEYLEQQLQENPDLQNSMERIERFTQDFIRTGANERAVSGVINIPVVVHVVYNQRSLEENISQAQIQSQIDVLNEDFRRLNLDASNTPSVFSGVAADVEIQFCLATVDPDGNPTDGITRTSTKKRSFGGDAVKFTSQGGKDAWPAGDYLNIWVCNLGQSLLGYAQFPGGSPSTDGIVCTYLAFGRGSQYTLYSAYNLGRTATHEVGHWLNLRHIWGDGNCNADDFVDDTPRAGGANFNGLPCTFPGPNSCDEGVGDLPDMFQNYMDYSDDGCMNLFTSGQTDRIRALFDVGGDRESLLNSKGCGNGTGGPVCDNGTCETGEDCASCPGDCGTCPPATCEAPGGMSSSTFGNPNSPKVRLSWNAVGAANSYTVAWGLPDSNLPNLISTTGTSVTISDLNAGQDYSWQVTADCGGESATSLPATFTVRRSDSNGRFSGLDELTVYPNPASNLLTVEFSMDDLESGRARILLNDVLGRVVSTVEVTDIMNYVEMDVSKLTNAVYFLRLVDGKGEIKATKKVLINR